MNDATPEISKLISEAAKKARGELDALPEPDLTTPIEWPVGCTVGPGLEGAIACETKVGYVNGSKGWLVYRGYDIFDLCANATYEEVVWLLLNGELPSAAELKAFKKKLGGYKHIPETQRLLMSFPIEAMSPMAAL